MSRVLIVGASARAAAASALRAGLDPWCADLFADADLRALVPDSIRCPAGQYPSALTELLRDAPAGPLMYTGGLENHPNLVWRLAKSGRSGETARTPCGDAGGRSPLNIFCGMPGCRPPKSIRAMPNCPDSGSG